MKFCFDQKVPIMSYLIAIAAGNIKSRKIGPRLEHLKVMNSLHFFRKSANIGCEPIYFYILPTKNTSVDNVPIDFKKKL